MTATTVASGLAEQVAAKAAEVADLDQVHTGLADGWLSYTDWSDEWPADMPGWQRRDIATDESREALEAARRDLGALKARRDGAG